MSSWFDLADSVIGGAVAIEAIKAQGGAASGSQQQVANQPQSPQVIPQQTNVSIPNPTADNNKMIAMVGGGAAALLLLILVLK